MAWWDKDKVAGPSSGGGFVVKPADPTVALDTSLKSLSIAEKQAELAAKGRDANLAPFTARKAAADAARAEAEAKKAAKENANLPNPVQQELAKARQANQDGRPVFKALAETYRLASKYPGGIPATIKDKSLLSFGGTNEQEQTFDLFNAMNIRAATAKAKLLGANPTDKDLALTLQSVASPKYRFGNNRELIGQDYQAAAQKYFENSFKQRWITQNGGVNGTDAQGRSYPQALAEALRRPEVAQIVTPPWERRAVGGPVAAPRAAANVDTSGFKVKR